MRHDLGCLYAPAGVENCQEFFGCDLKEKLGMKQHFGWIHSARSGIDDSVHCWFALEICFSHRHGDHHPEI